MTLPSPTTLASYTKVDPEVEAAEKSLPALFTQQDVNPEPSAMIHMIRAGLDNMLRATPPPVPEIREWQTSYRTRDNEELALFIYAPANPTSKLPLLVWFHGGGGCVGHPSMSAVSYRSWALSQNCVIVAPQYRLGPEHKFPVGYYDCWDAMTHIAKNADDFGAAPTLGFVVGGESHGSNTAAAMAVFARDQSLSPPLTGAFLSAGSYVQPHNVPEEYKEHYLSRFDPVCLAAPGLNEALKNAFDVSYAGDYNSPINRATIWPSGHKGLPKTYFQSCGLDINRDDSYIYQDMLSRAGVSTRLDVYPGAPHCFWGLMPNIGQAQKWKRDSTNALKWLFGTSEPEM